VFDPETSETLRLTTELECSATEELKEHAMHAALYGETYKEKDNLNDTVIDRKIITQSVLMQYNMSS
jgi:hypothetical protein